MTRSYRPNRVFLTNAEAANFLRLSPRTLEKRRRHGGGPRYCKFGRRVLYGLNDLEAWVKSHSYAISTEIRRQS
jgi:hypothetical protein